MRRGFAWLVACACGGTAVTPDGSADAPAPDAPDAGDDWHALDDARYWSWMDLTALLGESGALYSNAAFDGRYVYWAAGVSADGGSRAPSLVRFDTQGPFSDLASWSAWQPNAILLSAPLAFDGRYVYIGPYGSSSTFRQARFDTLGAFGDASSLSYSTTNPGRPDGGGGAVAELPTAAFDGRYVHFTYPTAVRYDTTGGFQDRAAWDGFVPAPIGGAGSPAVFADPYVVFTPSPGGRVAVYDTRLPFRDAASWAGLAVDAVAPGERFVGSGSDGRYAYLVPMGTGPNGDVPDGLVARWDTSGPVTAAAAWQTFQLTGVHPLAKEFAHASRDGRFFYFLMGSGHIAVRFDTTRDFRLPAAWSAFDVASLLPPRWQAARFVGGVAFDGRYVYAAADAPLVARFDARTPPKMPKGFAGTFY